MPGQTHIIPMDFNSDVVVSYELLTSVLGLLA